MNEYNDMSGQNVGGVVEGAFLSTDPEMEEAATATTAFIEQQFDDAGIREALVAMSGGIDSTLTAALTVRALGSDHVLGLGMPCNKQDSYHMTDARTIAEGLGIEFREIQLQPLVDMFEDIAAPAIDPECTKEARGNAVARLRMTCAYYAANRQSALVVGTANRSELLLGYFTKYGDGAADLYPLGDLYKTEVRALAQHLGLPRRIIHKPSTAGLWAGQTDEGDLGAPYRVLDRFLQRLLDQDEPVDQAAASAGLDTATARRIATQYSQTAHKRALPPTPQCPRRSAR